MAKKKPICSHCNFPIPEIYKYPLDDLNVTALLKLWHHLIETKENKINVNDVDLILSERLRMTQLRFHGLVAMVRNSKGKHIANTWLLTGRGAGFLKNQIQIRKYVHTQCNKVVGHSGELLSRKDFRVLDNFQANYEIMQGMLVKPAMSQPRLEI